MSYWVGFEIDTGGDFRAGVGDDRNYTSNCAGMWELALGRSLADYNGAPSSEAAGPLAAAVERMAMNPSEFRPMEPGNGWGSYEGAMEYLRWIAETAQAHPRTTIRVSH